MIRESTNTIRKEFHESLSEHAKETHNMISENQKSLTQMFHAIMNKPTTPPDRRLLPAQKETSNHGKNANSMDE